MVDKSRLRRFFVLECEVTRWVHDNRVGDRTGKGSDGGVADEVFRGMLRHARNYVVNVRDV
jgi:hypothetical protein